MRLLFLLAALAATGVAARDAEDPEAARARLEARVKGDLARRKDAAPEAIRVADVVERTWPDERLGCGGDRRVVSDPVPVPGYRIVLTLEDRRYVYHAARDGRFVPCDQPPKPIDRIR